MAQQIFRLFIILVLTGGGARAADAPSEFAHGSAVTRGADLTGRVVETRDGKELGRVHDFALDLESGRIAYVVLSVGSFLIEDSLIAVAPDALRHSADADGRLILETDPGSLRNARRFAAGDWSRQADVLAAADADSAQPPASAAPDGEPPSAAQRGTATISDGNRTATLSAGERSMRFENPPPQTPAPADPASDVAAAEQPPAARFDRLDRNRDGILDRAEIAHELTRDDRYADIDSDGNGAVDRAEFEALVSRRQPDGGDS